MQCRSVTNFFKRLYEAYKFFVLVQAWRLAVRAYRVGMKSGDTVLDITRRRTYLGSSVPSFEEPDKTPGPMKTSKALNNARSDEADLAFIQKIFLGDDRPKFTVFNLTKGAGCISNFPVPNLTRTTVNVCTIHATKSR